MSRYDWLGMIYNWFLFRTIAKIIVCETRSIWEKFAKQMILQNASMMYFTASDLQILDRPS